MNSLEIYDFPEPLHPMHTPFPLLNWKISLIIGTLFLLTPIHTPVGFNCRNCEVKGKNAAIAFVVMFLLMPSSFSANGIVDLRPDFIRKIALLGTISMALSSASTFLVIKSSPSGVLPLQLMYNDT